RVGLGAAAAVVQTNERNLVDSRLDGAFQIRFGEAQAALGNKLPALGAGLLVVALAQVIERLLGLDLGQVQRLTQTEGARRLSGLGDAGELGLLEVRAGRAPLRFRVAVLFRLLQVGATEQKLRLADILWVTRSEVDDAGAEGNGSAQVGIGASDHGAHLGEF